MYDLTELAISYALLFDRIEAMRATSSAPDESVLRALTELTQATEQLRRLLLRDNAARSAERPIMRLVTDARNDPLCL